MRAGLDPVTADASYDPAVYHDLLAVEDRHFWFRARNRAIAAVFAGVHARLPGGYRVLEVGCGTGNVLRALEGWAGEGAVVGMDLYGEGLVAARRRVGRALLVRGDATRPPFSVRFDVIGLFDVLEHLDDDVAALRALRGMLVERGTLILTVPADPRLWSYFDVASHHKRRYTEPGLGAALTTAGYSVEYLTPYMSVLRPVLRLGRRFAARHAPRSLSAAAAWEIAAADLRVRPVGGKVLDWMLAPEPAVLRRRRRLPFGASLLAVARSVSTGGP